MNISKRLGRFTIQRTMVEDNPDAVIAAMAGMIIVRAEMLYADDSIEYVAMSENFQEVRDGERFRSYTANFETVGLAGGGFTATFNGWK